MQRYYSLLRILGSISNQSVWNYVVDRMVLYKVLFFWVHGLFSVSFVPLCSVIIFRSFATDTTRSTELTISWDTKLFFRFVVINVCDSCLFLLGRNVNSNILSCVKVRVLRIVSYKEKKKFMFYVHTFTTNSLEQNPSLEVDSSWASQEMPVTS